MEKVWNTTKAFVEESNFVEDHNDKIEMKTMLLREHGQHLLQAYFRKNSIVFKNVIEGCWDNFAY